MSYKNNKVSKKIISICQNLTKINPFVKKCKMYEGTEERLRVNDCGKNHDQNNYCDLY